MALYRQFNCISTTWHLIFNVVGNGEFSERGDIQLIFSIKIEFTKRSITPLTLTNQDIFGYNLLFELTNLADSVIEFFATLLSMHLVLYV